VTHTDPAAELRSRQMFVNDLPFWCQLTAARDAMVGGTGVGAELRAAGGVVVRTSYLATVADIMAGIPANLSTLPRLALTLDIAVHTVGTPAGDALGARARVLKVGRNKVATEVEFFDEGSEDLVAVSFLTFVPSPRPQDLGPTDTEGMRPAGSLRRPLPEHVGLRMLEPGVVEIDHRPAVTQGSDTLQGGIVALLGEMAAESLTGQPVLDLDTRFLATVRRGPGRAVARNLGGGVIRCEVRDVGNDGRLAALVTARVAPSSPRDGRDL
jgi:acyl-coenzyme A thioesterase PaaI-like protein